MITIKIFLILMTTRKFLKLNNNKMTFNFLMKNKIPMKRIFYNKIKNQKEITGLNLTIKLKSKMSINDLFIKFLRL